MDYRIRPNKILVPYSEFKKFLDEVKSTRYEVGGLLIGSCAGEECICKKILVGKNILENSTSFRLSDEFLANTIYSLKEGEDIIGIIHSHPAAPYPSEVDRRYMKLWPIIWVIVNSVDLSYKAWINDHEINLVLY